MGTKKDGVMNLTVTPDTLLTGDLSIMVLGNNRDIHRHFGI